MPEQENQKCQNQESPEILEEVEVEELAIDGICGVY
ncbi:variant-type mycofactocin precursor [Candidatus Formimonas warabiya]|uniref:Mycofactocin n=1 Tax=Formimonas warabiya TaxID=1761012 RepID=A0A3G1KR60_FORW1|nr:variant-type mycofactocin precursor [Candidatus Formimonas warabiya]ATW24930.1 mycofactocin precursor [Candidatus Formimonas warabiya]